MTSVIRSLKTLSREKYRKECGSSCEKCCWPIKSPLSKHLTNQKTGQKEHSKIHVPEWVTIAQGPKSPEHLASVRFFVTFYFLGSFALSKIRCASYRGDFSSELWPPLRVTPSNSRGRWGRRPFSFIFLRGRSSEIHTISCAGGLLNASHLEWRNGMMKVLCFRGGQVITDYDLSMDVRRSAICEITIEFQ